MELQEAIKRLRNMAADPPIRPDSGAAIRTVLAELERLRTLLACVLRGKISTLYGWDATGGRMAYWGKAGGMTDKFVGPFATAIEAAEAAGGGE